MTTLPLGHGHRPVLIDDHHWQAHAACQGDNPDVMFPDDDDHAAVAAAKAVCAGCPVQAQCLERALLPGSKVLGVAGGMTEQERKNLRRRSQDARRRRVTQ